MTTFAACTICGRENCKVRELFTIGDSRHNEPPASLGLSGYCPTCACSFKVATPQLALAC